MPTTNEEKQDPASSAEQPLRASRKVSFTGLPAKPPVRDVGHEIKTHKYNKLEAHLVATAAKGLSKSEIPVTGPELARLHRCYRDGPEQGDGASPPVPGRSMRRTTASQPSDTNPPVVTRSKSL